MNKVLDYIPTFADVRALLGVSSDELEDDDIDVRVFVRMLELDLRALSASLMSEYITIQSKSRSMRSTTEQQLFEAVQTYATFHVADQLCSSLPQFSPKTISDGKAFAQRHADSPYKVTIDGVARGKLLATESLKAALGEFLGSIYGGRAVFTGMRVSTPTADPVTGS